MLIKDLFFIIVFFFFLSKNKYTMEEQNQKKILHFKVGEFEIAITYYSNSAVMIMHNEIPGFGSIIYTETVQEQRNIEQLLGPQNEHLCLFATQLSIMMEIPSITFIFAFKPDKLDSFEKIRSFMDQFQKVLAKSLEKSKD